MAADKDEPKKRKKSPTGTPIRRPVVDFPVRERRPEIEDDPDADPDLLTDDEIEDSEKLHDFQSQFGGKQYYVRIERLNEATNDMEIVDKVYLDSFDMYHLAKKYGGGKFICSLLNERGQYVKGGRMHFVFAKTSRPMDAERPSPLQDPAVLFLIEQMKTQQMMMAELFKTSLGAEKQTDIEKLIGAMKGLHEMNPRERDANPMKMLSEMMELQMKFKEMNGETEGSSSGMWSDIKDAMKVLMETRAARPALPPNSPSTPRPGAGSTLSTLSGVPIIRRTPTVNPDPGVEMPKKNIALEKLLFYLPKFETAAKDNAPVEKWASFLVDVLDTEIVPELAKQYSSLFLSVDEDTVWEKLLDAAEDETQVAKIFDAAPSLLPYREWVLAVVKSAYDAVQSDEEPDPPFEALSVVPANGSETMEA